MRVINRNRAFRAIKYQIAIVYQIPQAVSDSHGGDLPIRIAMMGARHVIRVCLTILCAVELYFDEISAPNDKIFVLGADPATDHSNLAGLARRDLMAHMRA